MGESYIDVFMALLDGPVKGDRPSRSANVTATNSQLRAYARVRGLICAALYQMDGTRPKFPGVGGFSGKSRAHLT